MGSRLFSRISKCYFNNVRRLLCTNVPHMIRSTRKMYHMSGLKYHKEVKDMWNKQLVRNVPCIPTTCHMATDAADVVDSCTIKNEDQLLQVTWSSGEETFYPYLWLRDSCQCQTCFDDSSRMRLFPMKDLDVDLAAASAQVNFTDKKVTVMWSDGHESSYSSLWLRQRVFTPDSQEKRRHFQKRPPILWDAGDLQDNIPTVDYNEMLVDDKVLFQWLSILEETGICLLHNTSLDPDKCVQRIANRVAYMKETHYGGQFSVKVKVDASNGAYTSTALGLHTDLSCLGYVPGLQILSCIKQVPMVGGENQFADGFHVANQLRRDDPAAFRLLSTVPLHAMDVGTDIYQFNMVQPIFTIMLDNDGEICQIFYSNLQRDSFMTMSLHQVEPLFRALKTWNNQLYDPSNVIQYKLQPGEAVCFDNTRVLHARTGFIIQEDGERQLEGCYIDWDELRSRRRVLEEQIQGTIL